VPGVPCYDSGYINLLRCHLPVFRALGASRNSEPTLGSPRFANRQFFSPEERRTGI